MFSFAFKDCVGLYYNLLHILMTFIIYRVIQCNKGRQTTWGDSFVHTMKGSLWCLNICITKTVKLDKFSR